MDRTGVCSAAQGGQMNQIDLGGRHAVVTGGASGIGLAIAHRLAASGAAVTIWDRDEAAARAAAAALAGQAAAVAQTRTAARAIDILINNAGITGPNEKLWDYPVDAWNGVFAVNVHGV